MVLQVRDVSSERAEVEEGRSYRSFRRWLVAGYGDPRVVARAPFEVAIDNLART